MLVRGRDTPDLWDAFTTDMGMPADPALYGWISCLWSSTRSSNS
jgi:hypothetical protein